MKVQRAVHCCSISTSFLLYLCFILITNKGSCREVYRDCQPSLTSSTVFAKGCLDHRFRAPPAYIAQLLTLYQIKVKSGIGHLIISTYLTLRISSNIWTTLEQSPTQILTELRWLDFSDCMRIGIFKLICRLDLRGSLLTQLSPLQAWHKICFVDSHSGKKSLEIPDMQKRSYYKI